MYTNQVENILKEKVENMSLNELKELALKALMAREKAKLRKQKFDKNKRKEKLSKNEI
ncbi:Uncharacterised protein [uncultured Clostridium sp.]|nr:Uncharacterised protein [uncultured Clostridium sp.]